jgi:predicted metal-binding transcription factor (methanogenesis marker protein 9)
VPQHRTDHAEELLGARLWLRRQLAELIEQAAERLIQATDALADAEMAHHDAAQTLEKLQAKLRATP